MRATHREARNGPLRETVDRLMALWGESRHETMLRVRHVIERGLREGRRPYWLITHDGETHTVAEWARVLGVNQQTLSQRLKRGWSEARTLDTPVPPRWTITYRCDERTVTEWAEIIGISRPTLVARLRRGLPVAEALETPVGYVMHKAR